MLEMAEKTRIRKFRWDDLDRFTVLFNQVHGTVGSRMAADETFIRQLLSHPATQADLNGFVAERANQLVGFILVFIEEPISRSVGVGGIAPCAAGLETWRALLREAIDHAQTADVSVFHTQVPEDARPRRSILEREGFTHVRTFWDMHWQPSELPEFALDPGMQLRSLVLDQDEAALTEVQNAAFGENWGFCPNTVEQIAARVRYKIMDPEAIILLEDDGRVIGYNWTCLLPDNGDSFGRIEMTGIHPDYRGRGLGKVVVAAGLEYLRANEAVRVELEVDSDNSAATGLYGSLGFETVRPTYWYEKPLP